MSTEEHIAQLTVQVVALQAQLAHCSCSPPSCHAPSWLDPVEPSHMHIHLMMDHDSTQLMHCHTWATQNILWPSHLWTGRDGALTACALHLFIPSTVYKSLGVWRTVPQSRNKLQLQNLTCPTPHPFGQHKHTLDEGGGNWWANADIEPTTFTLFQCLHMHWPSCSLRESTMSLLMPPVCRS